MKLTVRETEVYVEDTEQQVLQKLINQINLLPKNSIVALWPNQIGRAVISILAQQKSTIQIAILGQFRAYDLVEFLKPIAGQLRILPRLPNKVDLSLIIPRPTTLDYALLTVNEKLMPHSEQTLIDEIGVGYGYERQGSWCRSDVESSESEVIQQPPFTQILIDQLIERTNEFCFVFKGDLYKDCCATVLEMGAGLTGRLLQMLRNSKKSHYVIADVLSSSQLTQIMQPWLQEDFKWTHRAAKMAFCQVAARTNKPLQSVCQSDFADFQINIDDQSFLVFQEYVLADMKSRIKTINQSFQIPDKSTVLVFSPHPDDDVISAGAAVKSLCCKDVKLHVAYCVSGAVAVPDSFVMDKITQFSISQFDVNQEQTLGEQIAYCSEPKQNTTIQEAKFITHDTLTFEECKNRFSSGLSPKSKGLLREIEAMSALNYFEFFNKPENQAHFLRLPFYGTGFGRRNTPERVDVERIIQLLNEVKPNVILLAGDLSDPHGTHGHCYFAIKDAVEEYEKINGMQLNEEKFQSVFNTRLVKKGMTVDEIYDSLLKNEFIYKLMYRGAWSEFNIEDSSFIISFTKQQMNEKMLAIRQHLSQMGQALYLGGDPRSFDDRAKQRNSQTAKFLKAIGLVEDDVEGAECFVGCGILP